MKRLVAVMLAAAACGAWAQSERFGAHAMEQCVRDAMAHEMLPMPAPQAAVYCACFVGQLNEHTTDDDDRRMARGDTSTFEAVFRDATMTCMNRVVFKRAQ